MVNVNLSEAQIKKAVKGAPIQIKPQQMKGGKINLVLHPENMKKMSKAAVRGRGVRIMLSPEEIAASGLMDWLKGAFKFVKEKVIPTAKTIYEPLKPFLAPLIKQGVQTAAEAGIQKLGAKSPFAADVAKQLTPGLIDLAGQQTGAYGVKKRAKKAKKAPFLVPYNGGSFRAF